MADNKEIIEAFFKKNDFDYELDKEGDSFSLDIQAENIFVSVKVIFDNSYLLVVAKMPFVVDSKKTNDICELLFLINDTLISGGFDFNRERGIITFRTGLHLINLELTEGLFENLLFNSVSNVDNFTKTISQVLISDMSPADAFKLFETTE